MTNEKNKTQEIINNVINNIKNNKNIDNDEIIVYGNNRYDYKYVKLISYLMKLYNIKVPLRTQGWINKSLVELKYNDDLNSYSYVYSGNESKVFFKYLDELINKINKEDL